MKTNYKKMYAVAAVVIVGFVVLNVAGFFFHVRGGGPNQWTEHVFAGKVSERTEDHITVTDARGISRTFVVTDHTKIVEGKEIQDNQTLTPGTFVMVQSVPSPEAEEEAVEIRIVTTYLRKSTKTPQ